MNTTTSHFKFIGVDPGKSGGIVVLDENLTVIEVADIKKQTHHSLSDLLARHNDAKLCFIEKVHSMPGQGVSTTFAFGEIYGLLQGLIIANKIPIDYVTPRSWQAFLGIKKKQKSESQTDFKRRLKQHAQNKYPREKIINNTADAYLIAEYTAKNFAK